MRTTQEWTVTSPMLGCEGKKRGEFLDSKYSCYVKVVENYLNKLPLL